MGGVAIAIGRIKPSNRGTEMSVINPSSNKLLKIVLKSKNN